MRVLNIFRQNVLQEFSVGHALIRNSRLPKIARTCCRAQQKQALSSWGVHTTSLVWASLEIPSGPSFVAVSEPMCKHLLAATPLSATTCYVGCKWAVTRLLWDCVLLTGKYSIPGDCLKVYCLPDTSHSYQVISEALFWVFERPVAPDFAILQVVVQLFPSGSDTWRLCSCAATSFKRSIQNSSRLQKMWPGKAERESTRSCSLNVLFRRNLLMVNKVIIHKTT